MEALGGVLLVVAGLAVVLAGLALIIRFYQAGSPRNPGPGTPAPDSPPDSPDSSPAAIPADRGMAPSWPSLKLPAVSIPSFPRNPLRRGQRQAPGSQEAGAQPPAMPDATWAGDPDRLQRLRDMRRRRDPEPEQEYVEPIAATHGPPRPRDEHDAGGHGAEETLHTPRFPREEHHHGEPAPAGAPLTPTEVLQDADSVPADLAWRGGRPPRDTASWREAQEAYPVLRRRSTIMPVLLGSLTIAAVAGLIWVLLGQRAESAPLPPGTAVVVVADFGQGEDFAEGGAGQNTAESLRKEIQARAGSSTRLIVRRAGLISNRQRAVEEMRRQNAHAILWGTLPAGAAESLSATLTWRTAAPSDPWLVHGPAGRLIVPLHTPLPGQPLVAQAALAPLMAAILHYQAGNYDLARQTAEGIPGGAPADTANVGGFIRANALLTYNQVEDARALYEALDARGWRPAALYNNWGVALSLAGDQQAAGSTLNRGLEAEPPAAGDLMMLHANRAAVAHLAGDRTLARAEYDEALEQRSSDRLPGVFAHQQFGYLLYQQGDTQGARSHTLQALELAPDNAYAQRNLGLITMMERQARTAQTQFQQALATFRAWADTVRSQGVAAETRGDTTLAAHLNELVRGLNYQVGTTQYYVGLALADQAADEPPEGFIQGIFRRIQGRKTLAEQAVEAFEEAIRLDQDREDVRYQMGVMYRKMGEENRAVEQFNRAKELNPAAPGAYEQLAGMYSEDRRLDLAAAEYESLLLNNPGHLKGYIDLADVYLQGNNPDAARETYQRALSRSPANARDHYYRAQALYALARYGDPPDPVLLNQAAVEAQAAFMGEPGTWEAHLLLGEIFLLTGQDAAALEQYNFVLEQQPDNVDALYQAGRLLAASGLQQDALRVWQRVVELRPRHPVVHMDLGRLYESLDPPEVDRAIQEYRTAGEIDDKTPVPHLRLGDLHSYKKEWPEAANAYQEALERNIDLVEAWQGLIGARLRQGRTDEALQTAQSFQQHAPGDLRAYLLLGEVFLARRDHAAAIQQFEQALRLDTGSAEAFYGLGRAYALRGDVSRAAQYFDAALQSRPDYVQALTAKGDMLFDLGRYGEADEAYIRALQIDQNYPPAYVGRGRVLDRTAARPADYEEARKKLERAAELDPTYAEPHYYLGEMYAARQHEQAMRDNAIREYSIAAGLRPGWALPHYRLGQMYLSQQKLPEAINAFSRAVENEPNLIEGWFGLAQAERASGKRKEAITHYRKALELNNNYANAWLYLGYTLEEDGQRTEAAAAFRRAYDAAVDEPAVRSAAAEALRRYQ